MRKRYFGIGIDQTLPVPRSVNHSVSPAGSIPVGVTSPSFRTVTWAVSPVMVSASIRPEPFAAWNSFPLAARMPSGPLTGASIQMSTGAGLAGRIYGNAVELVKEHIVYIEHAV